MAREEDTIGSGPGIGQAVDVRVELLSIPPGAAGVRRRLTNGDAARLLRSERRGVRLILTMQPPAWPRGRMRARPARGSDVLLGRASRKLIPQPRVEDRVESPPDEGLRAAPRLIYCFKSSRRLVPTAADKGAASAS